jgi:PAS domain-containing protein
LHFLYLNHFRLPIQLTAGSLCCNPASSFNREVRPEKSIAEGVASPSPDPSSSEPNPVDITFRRIDGTDSTNPLVRIATQQLKTGFAQLQDIQQRQSLQAKLHGDREFIQVVPYQDDWGLVWLIVTVVPEADFMTSIWANLRRTVWLCLLAMATAIGSGVWITLRVAHPLRQLGQAAQTYGTKGNLLPVSPSNVREVDALQAAFEDMMQKLEENQAELAIAAQNQELERFFSAALDLLCIADIDGHFRRLNRQWETTLG